MNRCAPVLSLALAALGASTWCLASEAPIDARVRGQRVFEQWCVMCHGRGTFRPGTNALRRHGIDPPYLTERADITPELTRHVVRVGIGAMTGFRKTEISDEELADLAAFLAPRQQLVAPVRNP